MISFYDLIKDVPIHRRPMTKTNPFIGAGVTAGFALVGRQVKIVSTQEYGKVVELELNSENIKGYGLYVQIVGGKRVRCALEELEFLNNGAKAEQPKLP